MAAAPAAAAAAAAAQAVPRIACPPAGLTGVSVGNNQNNHGLALLPPTWAGRPNFFDRLTDADAEVLRLLGPFGDTGAVLGRLSAFQWRVGDGPLFRDTSVGPQWHSATLAPERAAALVAAAASATSLDSDDDEVDGSATTKKQLAANSILALGEGASGGGGSATADRTAGPREAGDDGRTDRAAKRSRTQAMSDALEQEQAEAVEEAEL